MAPAKGMASPHTRFCKAIANEKVSRPQPRSIEIGRRNRPKLCRVPRASIRIRPPQTSTTLGVRQFEWFRPSSSRCGYRGMVSVCPGEPAGRGGDEDDDLRDRERRLQALAVPEKCRNHSRIADERDRGERGYADKVQIVALVQRVSPSPAGRRSGGLDVAIDR